MAKARQAELIYLFASEILLLAKGRNQEKRIKKFLRSTVCS